MQYGPKSTYIYDTHVDLDVGRGQREPRSKDPKYLTVPIQNKSFQLADLAFKWTLGCFTIL